MFCSPLEFSGVGETLGLLKTPCQLGMESGRDRSGGGVAVLVSGVFSQTQVCSSLCVGLGRNSMVEPSLHFPLAPLQ